MRGMKRHFQLVVCVHEKMNAINFSPFFRCRNGNEALSRGDASAERR